MKFYLNCFIFSVKVSFWVFKSFWSSILVVSVSAWLLLFSFLIVSEIHMACIRSARMYTHPDFTKLACTCWLLNYQQRAWGENFCSRRGSHPFLCQELYLLGFWVSVIAANKLGLITTIASFFIKKFSSKFSFYRVFRQVWESILVFLCVIFKVTLYDLCLG